MLTLQGILEEFQYKVREGVPVDLSSRNEVAFSVERTLHMTDLGVDVNYEQINEDLIEDKLCKIDNYPQEKVTEDLIEIIVRRAQYGYGLVRSLTHSSSP